MGNLQPEGAALERVPTAGSIRGAAYLAARIDLYAEIAGRRTRSQVLVGKNVVLDVPVAFMKDREIDRVECDSQDIMFRDGHVHYAGQMDRSEEHTSELQSPCNLVCRLLLEKKKDRR